MQYQGRSTSSASKGAYRGLPQEIRVLKLALRRKEVWVCQEVQISWVGNLSAMSNLNG